MHDLLGSIVIDAPVRHVPRDTLGLNDKRGHQGDLHGTKQREQHAQADDRKLLKGCDRRVTVPLVSSFEPPSSCVLQLF